MSSANDIDVDSIIERLLGVLNQRPGKQVSLEGREIKALCIKSREIFISQPVLLELEAPIKICGTFESYSLNRKTLGDPRLVRRLARIGPYRRQNGSLLIGLLLPPLLPLLLPSFYVRYPYTSFTRIFGISTLPLYPHNPYSMSPMLRVFLSRPSNRVDASSTPPNLIVFSF